MALFTIQTQGELHPYITQEWLLTNGTGAFAGSTVVGCNTRRYHGLLCAATLPPVGRIMALNRIGELVSIEGGREPVHELAVNHFGRHMHPRGDQYIRQFELDEVAAWEMEVEDVRIRREVMLLWKRNVVGIRYHVHAPRPLQLHLLPFVSLRDFHALQRQNGTAFDVEMSARAMRVERGEHALQVVADAGSFEPRSDWWFGHSYPIETDRGLDDTEDLFVPGALVHHIEGDAVITLWAGVGESAEALAKLDWAAELKLRQDRHADREPGDSPTIVGLKRAAADFVVDRHRPDSRPGSTIMAGYPWFGDWGRDSMISLNGLLLSTKRWREACRVLSVFAEYVSEGMIPNKFDDYTNEPSYNTVDASLWFVHACHEYAAAAGDRETFEKVLRPACAEVVRGYREGTRFGIHMDEKDGLIAAGDAQTQLTWMDAKCDGIAFTPRHGKAVEINALWYNALCLMGEEKLAGHVRASFQRAFWLSPFRGLADVVGMDGHKDVSIRPNQIFAVSLANSPLEEEQQRAVVEVVRRELLTPYGLRTLARGEGNYHGRYFGPPRQRDEAYHNGTVWPWPIGAFLEAYLRVHHDSADAVRQARLWLAPLVDHMLHQACIGQISEIFEGDMPHRPAGCPAQAWSVAEVLRLALRLGM